MNKQTAQELRTKLSDTLPEIPGYEVRLANATYSTTEITFKLKVTEKGEGGEIMTPEREAYATYERLYGLKPLDSVITIRGESYKITGYNTRARKMPLQATRVLDGARFKFHSDTPQFKVGA